MSDIRSKPDVAPAEVEGDDIEASVPDYPLAARVIANSPAHLKALAHPVRRAIVDLVMERAATITELAEALSRPKGTVDHHLKVLAEAGIVRVVRTRKVRAMTERFWGRTARTIVYDTHDRRDDDAPANSVFLEEALEEMAAARSDEACAELGYTTLRHARVSAERVQEFTTRLDELALDFTATERRGDTVFALLLSLFPTDRARLPPPS